MKQSMNFDSAGEGAIPPGTYYIVDRLSGGRLGWIKDFISGKNEWFALFAADSSVDDIAFCNGVRRGEFRLHPKVGTGISKGCITIRKFEVPQTAGTLAYGVVLVK